MALCEHVQNHSTVCWVQGQGLNPMKTSSFDHFSPPEQGKTLNSNSRASLLIM